MNWADDFDLGFGIDKRYSGIIVLALMELHCVMNKVVLCSSLSHEELIKLRNTRLKIRARRFLIGINT